MLRVFFSLPWMYFTTLPILLSDHKHLMFYKSSRLWHFKCKYDSNGHLDHISTSSHCDLHKDANKIATQNMYMKIWCTRVASISAKSCDTAEQFKINLLLYKSMCLYTRQLRNSGLEIRMLKICQYSFHSSTRNQDSPLKLFVRIDSYTSLTKKKRTKSLFLWMFHFMYTLVPKWVGKI